MKTETVAAEGTVSAQQLWTGPSVLLVTQLTGQETQLQGLTRLAALFCGVIFGMQVIRPLEVSFFKENKPKCTCLDRNVLANSDFFFLLYGSNYSTVTIFQCQNFWLVTVTSLQRLLLFWPTFILQITCVWVNICMYAHMCVWGSVCMFVCAHTFV